MPPQPNQSFPPQQQPLYPTTQSAEANLPYPLHPTAAIVPASVYPELGNYMGLEFNEQILRDNMPEYLSNHSGGQQVATRPPVSIRTTTTNTTTTIIANYQEERYK